MSTLIIGPWVGEFGWELFAWQGYMRAFSRKFDYTVAVSRENSRALYADFANEFIPCDPGPGVPDSFFIPGVDPKACFMKLVQAGKVDKNLLKPATTLFLPRRIGFPPSTHYEQGVVFGKHLVKPEYTLLGEQGDRQYDYIFHLRSRELRKEDNWSLDNWRQLLELLDSDKVACIGTPHEAEAIPGTTDLRGIELQELLNTMRNAKCAFGPSSGPMHLASLCALPHVVWSIPQNKVRYEENWNPLKTPVLFDSQHNWHPTPEYVQGIYKEWSLENGIG